MSEEGEMSREEKEEAWTVEKKRKGGLSTIC